MARVASDPYNPKPNIDHIFICRQPATEISVITARKWCQSSFIYGREFSEQKHVTYRQSACH